MLNSKLRQQVSRMKGENVIATSEKIQIAHIVKKYHPKLYWSTTSGLENENKERKVTNVVSEPPPVITNEEEEK